MKQKKKFASKVMNDQKFVKPAKYDMVDITAPISTSIDASWPTRQWYFSRSAPKSIQEKIKNMTTSAPELISNEGLTCSAPEAVAVAAAVI